jgi:hypothetical protein
MDRLVTEFRNISGIIKMSNCTEAKLPPPPTSASFGHKATNHGLILTMMQDKWAETTSHTSQDPPKGTGLKLLIVPNAPVMK